MNDGGETDIDSGRARELINRARGVRLVLTDCDGVLTDGGVYYSERGEEMKRFNIRDGMGARLLREKAGIETGIVTGEKSPSVARRAEKLKLTELHLGVDDKSVRLDEIVRRTGVALAQVAYIGDDVNDVAVLQRVGLAACPADAVREVKEVAHVICEAKGGLGAFRELADFIIAVQVPTESKRVKGGENA